MFRHPITNRFISADDAAILTPGANAESNYRDLMDSSPIGSPARAFWAKKLLSLTSGEFALVA